MIKLDSRTKIALGATAITAVLISRSASVLIIEALLIVSAVSSTGVRARLTRSLRLIWPMVVLVFAVGFIFFDMLTALLLALRLFNLLTVSILFFQAIDPEEMGDALRKLGAPFTFAFMLTTAMRYVPLIGRKIKSIRDAQQARGIDLRPRLKNIGNFMALLLPLLVQSFILSDELALAMESRGFGCKHRSLRRNFRFAAADYILLTIAAALLAALIWWEHG